MERLVDAAAGAQFSFGDRDVPLEASMQSLLEALARTIPEDNVVHAVVRDAYRGWKARRLEDLLEDAIPEYRVWVLSQPDIAREVRG